MSARRRVEDAVSAIVQLEPDVVLLDVHMPGGGGVEVIAQVRAARPGAAVPRALGLRRRRGRDRRSSAPAPRLRHQDDHRRPSSPTRSRRVAGRGRRVLAATGRLRARRLRRRRSPPAEVDPELDQLTAREREVLRLIARGYAYKEIAQRALHLGEDGGDPCRRRCCASSSSPTATNSPAGQSAAGLVD